MNELFGIPVLVNEACKHSVWALTRQRQDGGKEYTLFNVHDPRVEEQVRAVRPIRLEMCEETFKRLLDSLAVEV